MEEFNQRPLFLQRYPQSSKSFSSSTHPVLEERDEREDRYPQYFEDLRKSVEKGLLEDASVEEFCQHIWGLDGETIAIIMSEDWNIDAAMLSRFKQAFDSQQRVFRPRPHTAFRSICSRIVADVFEYFDMDPLEVEDEFWDGKGKNYLHSFFAKSDPDFVRIWKARASKAGETDVPPIWEEIKAFAEFSTFKTLDKYSRYVPYSRASHAGTTAPEAPTHDMTIPFPPFAALKRRRSEDHLDDRDILPRISKRARRSSTLTDDQLRLASYAVECLTQYADRRYVTGLFIDVCQISLYYFDRNLVLRTVSFDFSTEKGARYLALTLFALSQCNMRDAGYEPLLRSFERPLGSVIHENLEPIHEPTMEVDEYCFVLPQPPKLRVLGTRYYLVEEWLDTFYGVIGHGMSNFLVRPGVTGEGMSDEFQILKMAWWPSGRTDEATVIEYLQDQLPGLKNHLPDVKFSELWDAKSLHFPWTKMHLAKPLSGVFVRPMLHVSIASENMPLWQARNIEGFKKAFLDCLECHYLAYTECDILHGAISEKSLAFHQEISELGSIQCVGILKHWDIGPYPREETEIPNSSESSNGTGPFCFMAAELARDLVRPSFVNPVRHRYRHDLESFFYILVWASIHYDPAECHRDSVHPHNDVCGWLYKNSSAEHKFAVIRDDATMATLEEVAKPEFAEVFRCWINPLRAMFDEAFESIPEDPEAERYDMDTCGGRLTFHRFMEVIGETPRGLSAFL